MSINNLDIPEELRHAIETSNLAECPGYANFIRRSLQARDKDLGQPFENYTSTSTAATECRGFMCASFISKPLSLDIPCSKNLQVSNNLCRSLKKISTAAAECSTLWNNKITTNFGKMVVPLSDFQKLLENHSLFWHNCILFQKGEKVDGHHLRRRIRLMPHDPSFLLPELTSESYWVKANKEYWRMRHICCSLNWEFNGVQVGELPHFLDYLIMILEEHRFVVYSFIEHLLQLKKSIARLNDLCTNKFSVACDQYNYPGDRSKSPMWSLKHVFDSLFVMSRETSSFLKEVEGNADNCDLHKILGIIKDKEFKKARVWLHRVCCRKSDCDGEFATCGRFFGTFLPSKLMRQTLCNSVFKILDQLHCVLQGKIVGKSSVAKVLIGCFQDVLSKAKLIEKQCLDFLEHKKQKPGSPVVEPVSETAFAESVRKTSKQVDEAVQKLVSLRNSILSQHSPQGNIALWRVVFESCLVNLQVDVIRENLDETIKLGVKLLDSAPQHKDSTDLNQLHASIVKLIESYNGVLLDFLAMHKTMAEVTSIVAVVFVPRCIYMIRDPRYTGMITLEQLGMDCSFEENADNDIRLDELNMEDPDVRYDFGDDENFKCDIFDDEWFDMPDDENFK